jgi:hypothetical protein
MNAGRTDISRGPACGFSDCARPRVSSMGLRCAGEEECLGRQSKGRGQRATCGRWAVATSVCESSPWDTSFNNQGARGKTSGEEALRGAVETPNREIDLIGRTPAPPAERHSKTYCKMSLMVRESCTRL